jgi:hypothetical protein
MAKEYSKDELALWFEQKAAAARSGPARTALFGADSRHTNMHNGMVGNMYFFKYDPKFKHTLPMYDKYPLVMVIERYKDGFLGLNLHYLSGGQRHAFINLFNDFYAKKKLYTGIMASSSIRTNWDLIQSASSGVEDLSRACVKRYLFAHIRSQLVSINKDEYDKAIQLPIDEWVYKR